MSMNMNMDAIENSEPDGDVNWDEVIDDSDDNSNSSESLVDEESVYSFSNMYGPTQAVDTKVTYDPPASNTRRRKKAQ